MMDQINNSSTVKEDSVHMHKEKSNLSIWLKLIYQSKTGLAGIVIVTIIFLIALLAPIISPYDPATTAPTMTYKPPFWLDGGSTAHILGTDNLGRDILSRIIYGSRITLLVGLASVVVAGIIGVTLGLISGYFGGFIDNIIMRVVDSFLAIPSILLVLVFISTIGPGMFTLIFVLGITNWVQYARLIRGEVLSLKQQEYIKAARTMGVKNSKIITRHLLPNVYSTFIVLATLSVATTIIIEAALSFLGLGIQPPDVSWGSMLSDGRDYLATSWWMSTFPGIAIAITVLGIIFLGDWLRDVLDPRLQGRK